MPPLAAHAQCGISRLFGASELALIFHHSCLKVFGYTLKTVFEGQKFQINCSKSPKAKDYAEGSHPVLDYQTLLHDPLRPSG